jgi:hypothetical protein
MSRSCGRADAQPPLSPDCGEVNIGDHVLYDGRLYVLRGLDPMSVPNRDALLEDALEGGLIRAPLKDVEPTENRSGFESEGLG